MEHIAPAIKFTLSINDDMEIGIEDEQTEDILSICHYHRYLLGVWSENAVVESKSLYMLGTPYNSTTLPIISICTETYDPTVAPTTVCRLVIQPVYFVTNTAAENSFA